MKAHATRLTIAVVGLALCLIAGQILSHAAVLPRELKIEKVLDSNVELGDLAQSPRGELWLLERVSGVDQGTIRVFAAGAEADSLVVAVMDDCESGLLDVAFAPDYAESGLAFLYYVDPTGKARVDEVLFNNGALSLGSMILDLGTTVGGCCPGGGIEVGADAKLYVSVGDLEVPVNGQTPGTLPGKVLRTNLDGSDPGDNPSGTRVWAMGFRNGKDMDIDPDGKVYLPDVGDAVSDHADEINEVMADGNCGWADVNGDDDGDTDYYDPLVFYDTSTSGVDRQVDPEALVKLTGTRLGAEHEGTLVSAHVTTDEMVQFELAGTNPDTIAAWGAFYDPDADKDGTIDTGCPLELHALETGNDGWLYGAGASTNPGIWRIYRDGAGPREVSAPGSPFHLTVDKNGSGLTIGWERLEARDAHRSVRHGGQHAEVYQVREGDFPITAVSVPALLATTDGDSDGYGRRTWTGTTTSGSHYYLITAQGDNMEGPLGSHSDGSPRDGADDYCALKGFGNAIGDCIEDFQHPTTGEPMGLIDYNIASRTYGQSLRLSDFRGKAMKMDLSAIDCYWCSVQAHFHWILEKQLAPRDLEIITVMHLSYSIAHPPIAPEDCAAEIEAWRFEHRETNPILCDTDLDGNGMADVWEQLRGTEGCGGTPHNFYIDQGFVIWDFWCGASDNINDFLDILTPECNAETCE